MAGAGKKEREMIELSCSQLKKYYGAQLVLENITFEVQEGERVAVIGKNGCGKSTILKLITRVEAPDEGYVSIRKNAVTGYLEQMPVYEEEMTVRQVCEQAFRELVMLQEQMRALERALENAAGSGGEGEVDALLKKYTLLQEKYEAGGGYEMEERFARICTGLKLSGEFLEARFRTLSGGEKTLACLAKVLLQNPDILVLDEPTNHLDMSMLQWLEEYLKNYKGTVLMVSHDRYFLDAAATRILEVEDGTVVEYLGNYSYYLEEKERRRQRQLDAYKEQQKKVKAMEKAIKDMRSWAAQADNESMYKRAASMQKRLDRMEKVERPKNAGLGMRVAFEEGERSGKDVLLLEGVAKSFGEKKLFSNLDLEVYFQEHVALLGRNGCGKTTLLRMILGELPADAGSIRVGASARIGYLPQQVHFPREDVSVLEAFREGLVIGEGKAREELSRYLFTGESVFKKVENLSGGEKSRLYLAKLMQTGVYTPGENTQGINFLILDEPTNHLDILSRENLETALERFQGTLLIVSHDRYFLNKMADRMVEMTPDGACSYAGNYEYYRQEKAKRAAMQNVPVQETEKKTEKKIEKETERRWEKDTAPAKPSAAGGGRNQYRQKQLEQEIRLLEEQKSACEDDTAAAGTDYGKLLELEAEKKRLENLIDEKMEEWLELTEG